MSSSLGVLGFRESKTGAVLPSASCVCVKVTSYLPDLVPGGRWNRMLDPLLRPFVDAVEEGDAERELNELIVRHALPLAHAIVARKLRSFDRDVSGGDESQDREDVVNEAMATLLERLWRARTGGEDAPIESFESYAATVINSACAHRIRRRHPERARLKNRLRYVFSTDDRLALWMKDDLVCGVRDW